MGIYSSGPSIVPVCAGQEDRHKNSNRLSHIYWHYWLFPICAKRIHRRYRGQPALLNRHYGGDTAVRECPRHLLSLRYSGQPALRTGAIAGNPHYSDQCYRGISRCGPETDRTVPPGTLGGRGRELGTGGSWGACLWSGGRFLSARAPDTRRSYDTKNDTSKSNHTAFLFHMQKA